MSRAEGRTCSRCGADEWYRFDLCAPCQRRRVKARNKERRRDPIYRLWQNARERARLTKVAFDITTSDVQREWAERCPVLGTPWGPGHARPSLDRLRPELGYVPGNIAIISMKANLIKSSANAHDVARVAAWMRRKGL